MSSEPSSKSRSPIDKFEFNKLFTRFIAGDSLEELATAFKRSTTNIVNILLKAELLILRNGNYHRVHPTPFADSTKSKTPWTQDTVSQFMPACPRLEPRAPKRKPFNPDFIRD